jgi:thioredoxin-like negative regulator of GroEL
MAALGEGQAQPAWEAAIGLLRDDPDDAEGLHWLLQAGTTLEWWSDLAQALHEFLDRNPGDLSVRFALAGVLLRMGFRQEAWEECQRLQLLDPH